jgi:hypothetical protein
MRDGGCETGSCLRADLERDFVGRDLELLVKVVHDPPKLVAPLCSVQIAAHDTTHATRHDTRHTGGELRLLLRARHTERSETCCAAV